MHKQDPLSREAVMGLASLMRSEGWDQTADRIVMLYNEMERLRNKERSSGPRLLGELMEEEERRMAAEVAALGPVPPLKPKRKRIRKSTAKNAGMVPYAGVE